MGGVLLAGPDRLEMAGRLGVPQVVSVGALDMVNFGARGTVPQQFEERNLYVHNPVVTLMRTTKEENAELGRRIAASCPPRWVHGLFLPLKGVSMIDVEVSPSTTRRPTPPCSRSCAGWETAWSWWSSTWM